MQWTGKRIGWISGLVASLLAVVAACSDEQPSAGVRALSRARTEALTLPTGFIEENVGSGWTQAVGLTFAADGRLFVWEKAGRVWEVDADGTRHSQPFLDISEEVGDWRDHGFLGFALHPNFLGNGYVYLLYVVDYHHAKYFGTPSYDSAANQYFTDTIGRVTRYQARSSDGFRSVDPASRRVLLGETLQTGIPILHESHGVGSIVFGEDGTLLVSCGDSANYGLVDRGGGTESNTGLLDGIIRPAEDVGAFRAQMVDTLDGKILRIDALTGDGVPSNPFFDSLAPRAPRSRVWSLGLRNPYRMTLRPESGAHDPADGAPGTLYVGDVGWDVWEELDVVRAPGENLGWPLYEGNTAHSGYVDADPGNRDAPNPLFGGSCSQPFFPFKSLLVQQTLNTPSFPNPCNSAEQVPSSIARFEHLRPALEWQHASDTTRVPTFDASGNATTRSLGASGAPPGTPFRGSCSIGGVWYTGSDFPSGYENTYFHADFASGWIKNFVFDDDDRLLEVRNFAPVDSTPIVSLATHPIDGGLYYIAFAGTVRRIHYVGAGNQPPVAVASASVEYGASPLSVAFTGSASRDPELGSLTYSWDFGDGSPASNLPNPTHVFVSAGTTPRAYSVRLTVTDAAAASSSAERTVVVNDTPPTVSIALPTSGGVLSILGPSVLPLQAEPADAEQPLAALSCSWKTILHHNEHTHVELPLVGCSQSTIVSPIGCGDEDYYFEFEVAVADGVGLSTRASAVLYPDCVPTPIAPLGSAGSIPTFSFRRVLGADRYEIVVDDANGPGRVSLVDTAQAFGCGSGEPACSLVSPATLGLGPASFRVRAHNPVDGFRAWSQTLAFTVLGGCGDGFTGPGEQCDDGNAVNDDGCKNDCTLATCTDGARNHGETGVDCGGPCPACGAACQSILLPPAGASASSLQDASYPALLAIDGSPTTRWSSGFFDPQWLSIDLGVTRRVRRVVLEWESAASADYDLEVADGATGPWSKVYGDPNGNGGIDDIGGLNVNARHVRMLSRRRTGPWGNSLWEVRVYGDPSPGCGTQPAACGNGIAEAGEQCDDGNTVNDDACSNTCVTATCSDGARNQSETGVDCGGPCPACGAACQSILLSPAGASASSLQSASFPASLAIDGSPTTRWSSGFFDPQWLSIDLGASRRVRRVVLEWESAASADYDLEVADAATGPWTKVYGDPNGNGGIDDIGGLNVNARHVRMLSRRRTGQWGNSLWEVRIYGDPNSSCGASTSVCGNGVPEAGEQCDDGNTVNDDACSNACMTATCSDGRQNHGETGVDCGGPCAACGGACLSQFLAPASVSASSVESSSLPATLAVDGSLFTRWSSAYADPQWIAIDLGAPRRIRRVLLDWEVAASRDYDIQVADSAAGPWTAVAMVDAGNGGIDDFDELDVNARFVRVYSFARTTSWGVSLWEFQVFGDPNTGCGTPLPACENGVLETGESCDDGNTIDDDACSNACVAATCSDGRRNQGETAVDCGGPCAACQAECQTLLLTPASATASSVDSSSRPASLAIDGLLTTRWSSAYSNSQWIVVDLGAVRRVRRVVLDWEVAASADYDIQVSDSVDGPWTAAYGDHSGNGGTDDIGGLDVNGRYVRMFSRARTTSWGVSLWEFRVYGDTSPTCGP